ncbi:MAG TPA: energy transducer TonB [Pyrinomonadaceae bacterium]
MQSSLLRLAVALLAFGVGVSATMFWIAYRTPDVKRLQAAPHHAHPLPPLPPLPTVEELPPPPPPPSSVNAPVSGGIINGKALSKPAPVYPSVAVVSNVSGMVVVQVLVDESGRVVTAEATSGNPLLREAAVDAAFQARFAPTRIKGQPVKVSGTVTYNFVLP